ncbi:hypothetical protein LVJ82_12615 [Vitreoscilla massiliensis]|uniref:Transposase for insertion sequence element IS21-like C-terminal domain-containing protein n=1 Tax=Vitreoscilla massiliensis TaxID=1689272 RepID=A0ABY4DXR3_9NEIS|nr:hypothetical protein [Vitreoscilla massiliensis]UOO88313.1 hypothetical protein LVJ82_12615 [Vitreoscilla massiliensis]
MTGLNLSQAFQQVRLALNTYRRYLGLRLEVLRVNSQSLVRIDDHQYCVPVACVGKAITAHTIRLTNRSQLLAEYTRSFQRSGISYQPLHYLDLLERKPGTLRTSVNCQQYDSLLTKGSYAKG